MLEHYLQACQYLASISDALEMPTSVDSSDPADMIIAICTLQSRLRHLEAALNEIATAGESSKATANEVIAIAVSALKKGA
ncbi:MAG: hypothetical protein QM639_09790 [Rhodocyclaceae bacterium]